MSRDAFVRMTGVSRETLEQFDAYAGLLARWNARINLVSPSTLDDVWTRHFLDSAQLWEEGLSGTRWLDLGSGAGFPGLVVALIAKDRGARLDMRLIEADARKAAFLRSAAAETGAVAEIMVTRAERAPPQEADVVSARALAPLYALLGHARRHLASGGKALFLKGRRFRYELTEANRSWHMETSVRSSVTDPESAVLTVADIRERP